MSSFYRSKTGKIAFAFVGLMMAVALLGTAAPARAALTSSQVDSIVSLLESFGADQATIANVRVSLEGGAPVVTPTEPGQACGYTFAADLSQGDTGADVKDLQVVLNSDPDTIIAESGVGSKGNETEYFGSLTKQAVVKFQNKYASEVLTPIGLSAGTGYVGSMTRAKLNDLYGECKDNGNGNGNGNVEATGTALTIGLASDNPASSVLIDGQAIADLANYTLVNPTSEDVKVTKVVLKRTGISADSTLTNVYLFDGAVRLTDSATVSSGVISFNDSTGIIVIPAGGSKTIAVKSDIESGSNGQTVGVSLTGVEATADVAGTFPIEGNIHSISSMSLAKVQFNTTTTPSANSSLNPQDDYVMWQNTVNIQTRAVYLKSLRLRMIGSVQKGDLGNFRLYVDGVQAGSAVAQYDDNGYVTFDLNSNPVELKTGNRTIKMVGDIIGGSGRNFKFSLRQAADVEATDKDYQRNVLAQVGSSTFSARESGQQDVAAGTITITKTDDSPSANIKLDDSNVLLAKFQLKAAGEDLKIESLGLTVDSSRGTVDKIRNGALYADGVQVGSTKDLTMYGAATTTFNLGSSLIVKPGSPVTLEVRADTYGLDSAGNGNELAANDTLKVYIDAGSSNIQQMTSLGYIANSEKTGNIVTVVTGSMALAKYSAYAAQVAVVPQTAYKIGEYRLTADETEDVNLTGLDVQIAGSGLATSTDLTDLYVVYGGTTSAVKSAGATDLNWSINKTIPANTTWNVAVYADLASAITDGDTIITKVKFSGTTVSSSQTIDTGYVTGQTITAGVGSFTVATDASTPAIALNVANNTVKVAAFKFTATNETYTVDRVGVSVLSGSEAAIEEVILKDGSTVLKSQPFDGKYATSTGFTFEVPANSDKVLDVYLKLGGVGVGYASTGKNVQVALNGYRVQNTQGSTTTAYPSSINGNNQYVVKSLPTLAMQTTSDKLAAGTQTIGKLDVTADAAGTVSWKELSFNYGTSSGLELTGITLYDGTTQVPSVTATKVYASSTIQVISTVDQEIAAGQTKTYILKATIGGTIGTGAYVQTSIADRSDSSLIGPGASTAVGTDASLIWSDKSASSHSFSTSDWFNDYKLPGVPTGSYSLNY